MKMEELTKALNLKVVAFLQNPGFKENTPIEEIERYNEDQVYRRAVLSNYQTGKRLIKAFGNDRYNKIWWDNACLDPGPMKGVKNKADIDHIKKVIAYQMPIIIITFGVIAYAGVKESVRKLKLEDEIMIIPSDHPNRRGITTQELASVAEMLERLLK